MKSVVKTLTAVLAVAFLISRSGGQELKSKELPPPPNTVEMKGLNEMVPAGTTVQMKQLLTQPRPVASGGTRPGVTGTVNGIAVWSPLGDAYGVGVTQNGQLTLTFVSPLSALGTAADYPLVTINMNVPASVPVGTTFPLDMSGTLQSSGASLTILDKPGTLTIGGSISIRSVSPGGGTWPAGTIITISGTGFQPKTKVSTKLKICNSTYVSPTQMTFELHQAATLDSQPITLSNPDGSQVTFYSYLRGTLIQVPTRALLTATDPVFQQWTRTTATVGPLPAGPATEFTALAIQNPGTGTVGVTVSSGGHSSTYLLPSGGELMDELSVLVGTTLLPGDVVTVSATGGLQILGLRGDDLTGTVTPFLP